MTTSSDPQRNESVLGSLQRLAAAPVEAFEPRRPELERRLRAAIDDDTGRGTSVLLAFADIGRHRGDRARRWVALAGAACIIALVAVAALTRTSPTDEVVIASGDLVSVVLPSGAIIDGVDGLVVPEGALIDVDGFAVIDGRRFGPGIYRVTSNGDVVEVTAVPVPAVGVIPVDPDETVRNNSRPTTVPTTRAESVPRTTVRQAGQVTTPRSTSSTSTVRPTTTERNQVPPATRPPATRPPATRPPATRPPATDPSATVTRVSTRPQGAPDPATSSTVPAAITTTTTTIAEIVERVSSRSSGVSG